MSFDKILVANRGEIARRVLRAARACGLKTVAVHSDADAGAPFVREADEAVRIGPAPSGASYLDPARILGACWRTGAGAIHPGYGFLAENAGLRRMADEAGIAFCGPSAEAIRRMGDKIASRAVARDAGVPVIPGFDQPGASDDELHAAAPAVGFPLLVKASAGGGGKGMRICRAPEDVAEAIASCRREALKAFGDDSLYLERLIERPRHIEVQVLGDRHGHLVHLYERECSIQRRHQKIVEEAPSPAVSEALRARLCEAALRLARAIGYESAGTVEMILAPDGAFYFLEMNTRLQVEHPVTEMITGLDLVRLQIRIAQGHPLPFGQEDVVRRGHAIEGRLYAEDPARGYLPQAGTIADWRAPSGDGVRVDSGVETGSAVGIHYDPMLAKVIAHGEDRDEARARLARALEGLTCLGLTTNRAHLAAIVRHPAFAAGELDTGFAERHEADLLLHAAGGEAALRQAAVAAMCGRILARRRAGGPGPLPGLAPGFRNSRFRDERETLEVDAAGALGSERAIRIRYRHTGLRTLLVRLDDADHEVAILDADLPALRLRMDDVTRAFRVVEAAGRLWVHGPAGAFTFRPRPRLPAAAAAGAGAASSGVLAASMPGQVLKVLIAEGDAVEPGAPLLVLESMKMETTLRAPHAGTVRALNARPGHVVDAGTQLLRIEAAAG